GADISPAALHRHEQRGNLPSTLEEVLACCDVVVATTGARGLIRPEQVRAGQIILALSNPEPEITPRAALAAGAAYAADGTSVNNILGFPGILRGALETRARRYTPSTFVAAGSAIAAAAAGRELVPALRIGIGATGTPSGPRMTRLVDNPPLRHASTAGVMVDHAGVGVAVRHLSAFHGRVARRSAGAARCSLGRLQPLLEQAVRVGRG